MLNRRQGLVQSGGGGRGWGAETKHFNVGQYRRKQNEENDVQDASFFDHNNPVRRLLGSSMLVCVVWSQPPLNATTPLWA